MQKMRERWENASPEERDKMREQFGQGGPGRGGMGGG
jgi:hypothetical protein